MLGASQKLCQSVALGLLIVATGCFSAREAPDAVIDSSGTLDCAQGGDGADEATRAANLETERAAILRLIAVKAQIVADLTAGRLDLQQAVQGFRAAHGHRPIEFHPAWVAAFRSEYSRVADEMAGLLCVDVFKRAMEELELGASWQGRQSEAFIVREHLQGQLRQILGPSRFERTR